MLGVVSSRGDSTNKYHGHSRRVCFSPVSGRVFVHFPGESRGMVARALPALTEGSADAERPEAHAFMSVTALGGVSFGRRFSTGGRTEWSEQLPPEFLRLGLDNFASLAFQTD